MTNCTLEMIQTVKNSFTKQEKVSSFPRPVNPLAAKPFSTLGKLRMWAKVGFYEIHRKFSSSLTILRA